MGIWCARCVILIMRSENIFFMHVPMLNNYGRCAPVPTSFDHFLLHWPSLFIRKELSPAWDVLSVAVCWLLWGERNLRCFQKKSRDFSLLFADAIFFANFWPGPVAKKREDTIMSAVEMVHFPSTWQADSSLLTQWDYEVWIWGCLALVLSDPFWCFWSCYSVIL